MTRSVRATWTAAIVLLVVAGATFVGIHHGAGPDLRALVDSQKPAGRAYVGSKATGPLDLRSASRATPLPADQLQPVLKQVGFRGGYARVWTSGAAFFVSTALEVRDAKGATDVMSYLRDGLAGLAGTDSQQLTGDIPKGMSYAFFVRKPSGIYQICTGVVFPVEQEVHLISMCDDTDPDPVMVHQRAVTELARARARHPGIN